MMNINMRAGVVSLREMETRLRRDYMVVLL